jgi:hypothetical protein
MGLGTPTIGAVNGRKHALAKLLDPSQSDRTVEERKRFPDELVTF